MALARLRHSPPEPGRTGHAEGRKGWAWGLCAILSAAVVGGTASVSGLRQQSRFEPERAGGLAQLAVHDWQRPPARSSIRARSGLTRKRVPGKAARARRRPGQPMALLGEKAGVGEGDLLRLTHQRLQRPAAACGGSHERGERAETGRAGRVGEDSRAAGQLDADRGAASRGSRGAAPGGPAARLSARTA